MINVILMTDLIGQINNVLCTFSHLDSTVQARLLKNYCLSLYGCQLWDLENPQSYYYYYKCHGLECCHHIVAVAIT